jgi:hypothetical protein
MDEEESIPEGEESMNERNYLNMKQNPLMNRILAVSKMIKLPLKEVQLTSPP